MAQNAARVIIETEAEEVEQQAGEEKEAEEVDEKVVEGKGSRSRSKGNNRR